MINKEDKIISMLLLNSHESDRTYIRPDNTTYVCRIRKDKENTFYIPTKQLELELNLTSTATKTFKPNSNAPHLNILDKYYGKDWKLVDQNLPPH